ncbi:hypothetical protein NQ315_006356 [Exocentrus adspersus]|uniref:WD repeat-containing protein 75 second beta-propeller domain-containing protein n=1 Tax=Exocentrus adspersus TaxID=1586481 RepID=A0AAV8W0R7_9CUCU|nr:hypothetical protein NQ315_006356 [Exocentrus adspersus]
MAEEDVTLIFKGGGSIVGHKPIFSSDGENVYVCWKNKILEYSAKTSKLLYEYEGSKDPIIGYDYFLYDSFPCLAACTTTGKVTIWKTVTYYKILEKQIPVKQIKDFSVVAWENEGDFKGLVSFMYKNRLKFTLVDVKKCVSKDYSFSIKLEDQTHKHYIGISGSKYFSVAHRNEVYFVRLNDRENYTKCKIQDSRTFTCITCHPSEEVVLTGDTSGRVVVWQDIFSTKQIQTVFHWHTLPVRAVCFSTSGSYFYSGGEECVLVKWQFHDSYEKKFLPRIGAEIEHISVADNNTCVAVSTRDNAVRILDNQMDQIGLIQHLVLGKQYESGLIYDPRTKALVMNGNQGHIQFYSPHDMCLLYSVDVVGRNKITNERDCVMENIEVTKTAVSRTGVWLATVEERRDPVYHSELRLKFWKFSSEQQRFELNTSIEYPHDKSVKNIQFQPMSNDDSLRCVTLGDDKKFRIWQLVDFTTVYKTGVVWKSFGVGFYRDLNCCGLSFSVDGSLMAVGFDKITTAWTPDLCELKCSLVHPSHKEKIKYVKFGYSNQCHLLVSASALQLSVWNLLTLCLLWTVPVRVELLVEDPLSTYMAVLTSNKKVFLFSPISPDLVYSNEHLLKKHAKVIAATFVPSKYSNDAGLKWFERSHLHFIDSNNELYYISTGSSTEFIPDLVEDVLENEEKSAFGKMTPKLHLTREQGEPKKHLFKKDVNERTFKKFLEAPIHTMAPVRFTCYSLLKSFIIQKDKTNT